MEPHILDLSTSWKRVVSFTVQPLYLRGESSRYLLDRRLWWAPEPAWMTWRGEKSCPYWDSNSDSSAIQPIASHYTNCAIPDPKLGIVANENFVTVKRKLKITSDF
jgi:hypothetical protein